MKSLMTVSFKVKILGLVLAPLLALIITSGFLLHTKWQESHKMKSDHQDIENYKTISNLIHEMQKERGKTALFLVSNDEAKLLEQRLLVDKITASEAFEKVKAHEVLAPSFKSFDKDFVSVRALTKSKSEASTIVPKYTELILSLILGQAKLAKGSSFESSLTSLVILELAKEYTGRIRAMGSAIVKENQPIPNVKINDFATLRANLKSNAKSPIISVSQASLEGIQKLFNSEDWINFEKSVNLIIDKGAEGNFGIEADKFFNQATSAIEEFKSVINGEAKHVEEESLQLGSDADMFFYKLVAFVAMATLTFVVVGLVLSSQLSKSLTTSVFGVTATAVEIDKTFQKLRDASALISSGTAESAASLEETVASVEEIASMVNANATNSEKASVVAKDTEVLASKGEAKIVVLIENMKAMSAYSKNIESFVAVIDDIAFQINLLALNAAVEAARAGEQGKGFAVVAEAVRQLASRSAAAAREISELVSKNTELSSLGSKHADESGTALSEIVTSIKNVSHIVADISRSSSEQATGLNQISQAMNQLDQSTQNNAASAEETSSSADRLSIQSEKLKGLVVELKEIVNGH